MFSLLLKTLGVILLAAILIPLGILALTAFPIYIGSFFTPFIGLGVAMVLVIAELIGLIYFFHNLEQYVK